MTIFQLKLISASSIAFITSLVGTVQFLKFTHSKKKDTVISEALTAGIFLGVGLIHMLLDAIKQFSQLHVGYFVPIIIAGLMFLGLFLLEYLSKLVLLSNHTQSSGNNLAIMATVILSLHSFFEGAALGLTNNFTMLLIVFAAIIGHKGAAAFGLITHINKSQLRSIIKILIFSIFVVMTPLGIFFGDIANVTSKLYHFLEPLLLSIAAGTFIFLGITHGIRVTMMMDKTLALKNLGFVILGFWFMALVAIWV